MSDVGIKVSEPGYNVLTAEPDELAFTSSYKTVAAVVSGTGICSFGETDTLASFLVEVENEYNSSNNTAAWIPTGIAFTTLNTNTGIGRRYRTPTQPQATPNDSHGFYAFSTVINSRVNVRFRVSRNTTSVSYGTPESFTVNYFIIAII